MNDRLNESSSADRINRDAARASRWPVASKIVVRKEEDFSALETAQ